MLTQELEREIISSPDKTCTTENIASMSSEVVQLQDPGRDNASFLPDNINFPRLQTPKRYSPSPNTCRREGPISPVPQLQTPQPKEPSLTPAFVWGPKHVQEEELRAGETYTEKGKTKLKPLASKVMDSPITRQGYRTGRLAEDFWTALGIPNMPSSARKTLQVIPFLTKNPLTEHAEYLADHKSSPPGAIAQVHIAELLAGIPWTSSRARTHVVNEISQALHKNLIFNNKLSNPFQKWQQGNWFASWVEDGEGENTCTIFVCITVTDQKVKPRKGQNFR